MKVHVVDGTYELFRAHFGAPAAQDAFGREVGATRGFLRSLLGLVQGEGATHVACAFDHEVESFRNQLFDGYKTGEGIEPELLAQFPLVERAAHALGFVVWPMMDFEADDALATAAAQWEEHPDVEQVVICSPDKDLAQCVRGDRVVMLDRRRRIVLDEAAVHEKFGVAPAAIPDYLALVGDAADGIPGIPRWGPKNSSMLLDRFGSIDAIPRDPAFGVAMCAAGMGWPSRSIPAVMTPRSTVRSPFCVWTFPSRRPWRIWNGRARVGPNWRRSAASWVSSILWSGSRGGAEAGSSAETSARAVEAGRAPPTPCPASDSIALGFRIGIKRTGGLGQKALLLPVSRCDIAAARRLLQYGVAHCMRTDPGKSRVAVRVFATLVMLVALALLAGISWVQSGPWPASVLLVAGPLATVAYWLLLTLAAEGFWFIPRTGRAMVSMSLAVNLASILILPAVMALPIAAGSVFFADLALHRRRVLQASFNAAQTTVALGAAVLILNTGSGSVSSALGVFFDPMILVLAFGAFFTLNTGLVAAVVGLDRGESIYWTWRRCFVNSAHGISTVAHCLLAVGLAALYPQFGFVSGLASIFFFSLVKRAAEASSPPVSAR